jgi:di/tricarboxylate transporter
MILTFIILAVTIVVFIWDKLRVDIVAMLALLALVLTGIIDASQALAGFSNSTVITIAGLFVVGAGLFRTGVADWLGEQLLKLAGSSEIRLFIMLMLGAALLSAFLSNTGTVAVLLPAVVTAAWRIQSVPSKLLLPLAFAASIGGLLTLIGTPPNIVIADTLQEAGLRPFGFFEFSLIGIPLLMVGIVYMLLLGQRWLPHRRTERLEGGGAFSPQELAEVYHLGGNLFRLRVRRRSSLVGQTLAQSCLGEKYGVTVIRIERATPASGDRQHTPRRALRSITDTLGMLQADEDAMSPGPETIIYADDVLLVEGPPDSVHRLAVRCNLGIQPIDPASDHPKEELLAREIGLAEILITPRSALIGQTITKAHFAEKYDVRVLGISRRGVPIEDVPVGTVKLTFGDALLVRGTWKSIGIMEGESRNFVVVGRPATLARPTGLTPQAFVALFALAGMLLMMLTGIVSTVVAVLVTAMVMVLGGCLNMEQAYRAISWESVVLIAAMLPMSTAMQVTGGAEFIANGLVNTLGALHPLLLLVGMFVLTAAFTQVISNTATTVLVAPIAIQAAANLGITPYPIMMMVAVGASAAFLTPIASPVNTLVLTPGGYRFGDFMKIGMPLLVLFLVVSLLLVPLIWPL